MTISPFLLKIYLPKTTLKIPFDHLRDLYFFVLAINCLNKDIFFIIWDMKKNLILDVIRRKDN